MRASSRSELSIRSAVRKKLLAPGWFGSGTSAMIAAAYGSIRLAGIVLLAKFSPVSGSRTARGEDAGALVGRRHAGQPGDAAGDARALVVGEEERAVLDDRAAEVAAVLVLIVGRLRRRWRASRRSRSSRSPGCGSTRSACP